MTLYRGREVLYKGRSWWIGSSTDMGVWLERPGASIFLTYYETTNLTPVE